MVNKKTLNGLYLPMLALLFAGCAKEPAEQFEGAISAAEPLQFERGYPAAGTAEKVYDASDLRRAIEAYKFFYPTITAVRSQRRHAARG